MIATSKLYDGLFFLRDVIIQVFEKHIMHELYHTHRLISSYKNMSYKSEHRHTKTCMMSFLYDVVWYFCMMSPYKFGAAIRLGGSVACGPRGAPLISGRRRKRQDIFLMYQISITWPHTIRSLLTAVDGAGRRKIPHVPFFSRSGVGETRRPQTRDPDHPDKTSLRAGHGQRPHHRPATDQRPGPQTDRRPGHRPETRTRDGPESRTSHRPDTARAPQDRRRKTYIPPGTKRTRFRRKTYMGYFSTTGAVYGRCINTHGGDAPSEDHFGVSTTGSLFCPCRGPGRVPESATTASLFPRPWGSAPANP